MLQGMWDHWKAGDRGAALEAIPDELVDQLIVSGTPEQCRAHIQRYIDNGVTTPALAILPIPGVDQRQAIRDLAPR
jgi:alkanesulfonate monooxygenase SsuD/methylene tetrahydromethanopterin reductase-like flavin-dependent oxidoreductase (luciferase family)